jgi:hypothetical protein
VWLISSLTLREAGGVHGNAVVTSRSTNGGPTWSNPFTTATGGDLDKNWIVCDNTPTSPFYGHCYTQWDDHGRGNLLRMSTSTDGGQHWSAPSTNSTGVIGGQPVVRPNGTVIVPIDNANETAIGAFHSTNGGASWSAVTTIATIRHHRVAGGLREGPLPSAEIDGAGTVYVVWADCRFRLSCQKNDIVISHSLNAIGTSWVATTSQGRMVGDYISTSYGSDGLAHGVFATAAAPTGGATCGAVPDNCVEPMDTFASGLAAGGSASSAADPVLFGGNGGANANSLWHVVDNNGRKHRD